MFSLKATSLNDRGWRRSASSTLVNHLVACSYQPEEVKTMALNDNAYTGKKRLRSGSKADQVQPGSSPPPMPQIFLAPLAIPQPGASTGPGTLDQQTGAGMIYGGQSFPARHVNPSPMPSPLIFSPSLSLAPSDSISQTSSSQPSSAGDGLAQGFMPVLHPLASHNSQTRRPSSRRGTISNFNNPSHQYTAWSTEKQQSFESRLGRLTASAGLPFSWVDNPEWLAFVDEFIPAAQSPGRRKLTRTIIPKLVKDLRNQVKKEVSGQNVTIQADGWTGENHHHLIAFMITVRTKVSTS